MMHNDSKALRPPISARSSTGMFRNSRCRRLCDAPCSAVRSLAGMSHRRRPLEFRRRRDRGEVADIAAVDRQVGQPARHGVKPFEGGAACYL